MRRALVIAGLLTGFGLADLAAPASAQGFGQVTFGSTTAPPAPAPDAAKSAGHDVDSVTVNGKKAAAVDLDQKEVLCHSESVIGSKFPKKVCASRRELAERRANDQQVAQDFQRSVIIGKQN